MLTPQRQASIDQQFMAMDKRGPVAGQEHRSVGDVVWHTRSGDRLQLHEDLLHDIQNPVCL
jgi:hypothetical protein